MPSAVRSSGRMPRCDVLAGQVALLSTPPKLGPVTMSCKSVSTSLAGRDVSIPMSPDAEPNNDWARAWSG